MSKETYPPTIEQEFSGSGENVIMNVLLGKADAGAAFSSELERQPREVRDQLRAIVVTPEIAPHPLSAHPRVPRGAREAIRKAVLAIAGSPEGTELLGRIRMASPVSADYARDYRSLEDIDVKGLSKWGE